jgi:succinoglycan biosynthesis transport protein ExoP
MAETTHKPSVHDDDGGQGLGDLMRLVVRRRWLFLTPFFVIGLLGFSVGQIVPVEYRSEAFIIVDQQRVPEQYVTPNILITLQRRLDSMTQQILSRTRLQRFIEDFGLYTKDRQQKSMDDVIDVMRKKINIELVQTPGRKEDLTGFRIHFTNQDPSLAQRVTGELTSLFIEQNVRERTQQSMGTTTFLESQVEQSRKDLAEVEERVRLYKLKHLGQLPEQQQSNLQILSSLQAQLQANTSALDRAEQQRIYFSSMRSQYEAVRSPSTSEDTTESGRVSAGASSLPLAESTLADLWQQLNALTGKFTERHPDVLRLKKEIADWEAAVQRLRSAHLPLAEIDSKLKALQSEIENGKREGEEIRGRIREVQNRLNLTPVREQELAGVNRQYESARTQYQSLLQKKMGSELASNLEQRQGGEQFRLLDPANLPKRPEPGRLKIIIIGWVLGAGLGIALIVLKEFLDNTIHRDSDLEARDLVDVLVRIPTLTTAKDQSRQKLFRTVEVAGITLVTLVSLGTAVHTILNNVRF